MTHKQSSQHDADIETQAPPFAETRRPVSELNQRLQAVIDGGYERDEALRRVDAIIDVISYDVPSDIPAAQQFCDRLRTIGETFDHPRAKAYGYALSGHVHYLTSDHQTAIQHFLVALPLFERDLTDPFGKAQVLSGIAGAYLSLGDFEPALEHALQALATAEQIGNQRQIAWCHYALATGYLEFGDLPRAREYFQASLDIFRQLKLDVGIGRGLSGIGSVLTRQSKLEEAERHLTEALDLFEQAENKIGMARARNDLGNVFDLRGEYDKALDYYRQALVLRQELGMKQAQATSLIAIGRVLGRMGDSDDALEHLHRALTLAMEIRSKVRQYQANLALSEVYEGLGEHDNALAHYKMFHELREQVTGDEATVRIKNIEIASEVERSERDAEIERLRNVDLRDKNSELEQLLVELQTTQAQLVQSEKMAALGNLVAGIAHELNTPVGALHSAVDIAGRCIDIIIEEMSKAESIDDLKTSLRLQRSVKALSENNAVAVSVGERMTRIVNSLKSFVQLDAARWREFDLHEGLDATLTLLESQIRQRITIEKRYGDLPLVGCYPTEINQMFMHLLSNAAQAIHEDGRITITTSANNSHVTIAIDDTGVGISEQQLASLFDPNFSRKGSRVKAGLGLFTSYNIVKKHRGDIAVRSTQGEGSSFTVTLPITAPGRGAPTD